MGQLNKPLDFLDFLDNITNMKQRITKTKLLKHLTKQVNAARQNVKEAPVGSYQLARAVARWNALLEVRDYINMHRI